MIQQVSTSISEKNIPGYQSISNTVIISAASAACHVVNKGLRYAPGQEAPELAKRQSTINAGGALTYLAEGLGDIPGYRPLPLDPSTAGSQGARLHQGRGSSSTGVSE